MKMKMSYNFIIFFAVISISYSKLIESYFESTSLRCMIHGLEIGPCEPAENDSICTIRRGSTVTMYMSYTPESRIIEDQELFTRVKSLHKNLTPRMDGCEHTECPLEQGKTHNYTMNFNIPTDSLTGTKWIETYLTNWNDWMCKVHFRINIVN